MQVRLISPITPRLEGQFNTAREEGIGGITCRRIEPDKLKVPDCLLSVVNDNMTVLFKQ
jgi:hypothetical protein